MKSTISALTGIGKACPLVILLFMFFAAQAADPQSWFTENRGQVTDQYGHPQPDVRFIFVSGDFRLILKNTGFSYELIHHDQSLSLDEATAEMNPTDDDDFSGTSDDAITISRIDVTLKRCNPNSETETSGMAPFYQNFYNGAAGTKGIAQVRSFEKITYREIYPHIDLVFSINSKSTKKPEYSYIIHPHGDISKIQMSYSGTEKVSLNEKGDLIMNVNAGSVSESEPTGFYENDPAKFIGVSFIRHGNDVSFASSFNHSNETFVIDPVIDWATYYGGGKLDMPDEMGINSRNQVFLTGRTESTNMISTSGAHQVNYGGGKDDALLVKFDSTGGLLWASYYGGSKVELGYSMCMDNTDHAYICGKTNSTSGISTPGAYQVAYGGGEHDCYIAKFNDDGTLVWSTYYGGTGMDRVLSCTTDRFGTLYVTGYTEGLNGIATAGAYKTTGDLKGDAFISKFTSDGMLVFGTYFGSLGQDRGHSIAIDDWGNIITTGTTTSIKNLSTPGAFQPVYGGHTDMYLNKFTNSGALKWSTYFGGVQDDRSRACVTDAEGNIYLLGQTASTNISTTAGTFKPVFVPSAANDQDVVIAKFDSSGQRTWATYYGGNGNEQPKSLKIDRFGSSLYISGSTKSKTGLSTPGAFQKSLGGKDDAFFARINYNSSILMYSSYYGGKNSESDFNHTWYGAPLEIDHHGNIFLASATKSADSIIYGNAYHTTLGSDTAFDFFVAKFSEVCADPYENNDNIGNAPRLFFDSGSPVRSVRSTLQSASDIDYYQFTPGASADNIRLTVSALAADYTLSIFNADQQLISSISGTANNTGSLILNFATTGIYYIGITSLNGSTFSAPLCYQLDIEASDTPFRLNDDQDVVESGGIILFPDPASDVLYVKLKNDDGEKTTFEIISMAGQTLRKQVLGKETELSFPVGDLQPGTYFLKVSGSRGKQYAKFIKE